MFSINLACEARSRSGQRFARIQARASLVATSSSSAAAKIGAPCIPSEAENRLWALVTRANTALDRRSQCCAVSSLSIREKMRLPLREIHAS